MYDTKNLAKFGHRFTHLMKSPLMMLKGSLAHAGVVDIQAMPFASSVASVH